MSPEGALVPGLGAVSARITEIQARLGVARGTTTTTGTASATAFAATLSRALGAADATTGSTGSLASAPGSPVGSSVGSSVGSAVGSAVGSSVGPAFGPGADDGERAVALAASYTGVAYLWGGTDPDEGLDCSGLVQLVYRTLGVDLPRTSREQSRVGERVASLAQARPGDLVFFGSPVHHVGIYAGAGRMVDAPKRGQTVGVHKVWSDVTAIRRLTPEAGSGATTTTGATRAASPTGTTTTVNHLLAATRGFGSAAPGGLLGSAGDHPVQLVAPPATVGSGATAGTSRAAIRPSVSAAGDAGWRSRPYADLFAAAGAKHGVDPALLSAIAKAESGYRASARSHAGAIGLMQIMPGTARDLGVDPSDPAEAVDGAARLVSRYLERYDGDAGRVLAAYNAGPGAVRRYDGVPPYAETRAYVRRVTAYWEDLR